jgi:hypothetical protein
MEVVRARRLMRGEAHSAVERVLGDAQSLARLAALALFDDAARGSEVFDRLKREASAPFAEAFRQAEAGESVSPADAIDLARRTSNLAAWLRGLR